MFKISSLIEKYSMGTVSVYCDWRNYASTRYGVTLVVNCLAGMSAVNDKVN